MKLKKILLNCLAILAIATILPFTTTYHVSAETKTDDYEIEVTATEVIQTFEDNELLGEENYKGKKSKITGTVESVGKSFGSVYVTLKNDNDEWSIVSLQCFFKKANQKGISSLSKGDTVTLVGTIEGQSLNISVKDCKLITE